MRCFTIDERYEGDLLPGGEAIRAGHVHHVSEGGKDETAHTGGVVLLRARWRRYGARCALARAVPGQS
jgi:hypothetical protein